MTKRRMVGVLLILLAILLPFVLWALGITLVELVQGPEVVVHRSKTGPLESVVSEQVVYWRWNWLAFLPSLLLSTAGLACLLIPSRRRDS